MKKIVSIVLCFIMIFSIGTGSFADNQSRQYVGNHKSPKYTNEDVFKLKKYIELERNGTFRLEEQKALNDGIDSELIKLQLKHFDMINPMILSGKLSTNKKMEIIVNDYAVDDIAAMTFTGMASYSGHAYNCGGGINSEVEFHWWGFSRYACDCESNRMSADLGSASSVAAGAAFVAAFYGQAAITLVAGIDSSYWWYVSSRIDANNRGRGIIMGVTYVGVFNLESQ